MGKKTKRMNRRIRPPLTFLDKSIYCVCAVAMISGLMVLFLCLDDFRTQIAFDKFGAVAFRSHASYLFDIPFILFSVISVFVFFLAGFVGEKPIFGSKKYNYGEYPYEKDCVPLFYKREAYSKGKHSQQRITRIKAVLWLLWFLFCLLTALLIPLGLFGRDVLYQDNKIENINLFNNVSDTYTEDDYSHLTVEARYKKRGRYVRSRRIYRITIEMTDGKKFSFSNLSFKGGPLEKTDACLDKMLEIKEWFDSDAITVTGREHVDKVADYLNFNEQQKEKLNELFSKG